MQTWAGVSFVLICWFALGSASWAAKTKAADPYQRFTASCVKAFGSEAREFGAEVCACTAHESRHQGVPISVLKRETAQIEANPKHPIEDKRLLAAFHYCTIQSMKAAAGEG